jgi:hypothetical protein
MRFQMETATRVCTSLDDLGRELIRLRRLAAGAAASAGCLLVASGTAPIRAPGLAARTDQSQYQELARLAWMRPWLAPLRPRPRSPGRSLARRHLTACNRPADLGWAYIPWRDVPPERKPSRAR